MVHFTMSTWLDHKVPRDLVKHYSEWDCLWGYFLMRLTFELVDWVKPTVHSHEGGLHLISWRPEQNEKADPSMSTRELFLTNCLSPDISCFPVCRLKRKHRLFLGLELAGIQTGTTASAALGFQLADDCRFEGLSSSIILWANSL